MSIMTGGSTYHAECCTFEQFVSTISRILYGSAYEGCRWKRQGEQGNCWWDRHTQTYISTDELYKRMISELRFARSGSDRGSTR
jgi:hypothetical protein